MVPGSTHHVPLVPLGFQLCYGGARVRNCRQLNRPKVRGPPLVLLKLERPVNRTRPGMHTLSMPQWPACLTTVRMHAEHVGRHAALVTSRGGCRGSSRGHADPTRRARPTTRGGARSSVPSAAPYKAPSYGRAAVWPQRKVKVSYPGLPSPPQRRPAQWHCPCCACWASSQPHLKPLSLASSAISCPAAARLGQRSRIRQSSADGRDRD